MSYTFDHRTLEFECRRHVAKYFPNLAEDIFEIPVKYDQKYRGAANCGWFQSHSSNGLGRVVIRQTTTQTPERFRATMLHEFAHAVTHWLRPELQEEDEGHGPFWKWVMIQLGEPPTKVLK